MSWRRSATVAALASLAAVWACPGHAQARKSAAAASAASAARTTGGVDYGERFKTVCAACHGANGRSEMPGVPVLAGQPSLYTITQLFLFREGRRTNEAMVSFLERIRSQVS